MIEHLTHLYFRSLTLVQAFKIFEGFINQAFPYITILSGILVTMHAS